MSWAAVYVIWLREILRFWREKPRIITSLVQPAIWLFIMGQGMGSSFAGAGGINYSQYLFPGILGMAILFSALFSGLSIVWDREFGFLREILVAPVSRLSIVIGKAAAGSTTAFLQGCLVMLFAPIVGVSLRPLTILYAMLAMILVAFSLSSIGILVASRMSSMQGFQMVMSFVVMPMFFTSGALFPLEGLPAWLHTVILVNPLTYGVDLLKGIIIARPMFPAAVDLLVVACFTALFLGGAIALFNQEG